jgi:glycosyltransferase involved in cell wall biosynthesis
MRICLLAKSTLDHGIGGMETHFDALHENLIAMGHQVMVLTTGHPSLKTKPYANGSMTFFLEVPARRYSTRWWKRSLEVFSNLNAEKPFDLVFSQSLSAGALLEFQPRPPIYMVAYGLTRWHIKSEFRQCNRLSDYLKWLMIKIPEIIFYTVRYERPLLKNSEGVLCTGDSFREDLARYSRNVIVSYNGADCDKFRPDPGARERVRQSLGIPSGAIVIVMAGVVSLQKGMDVGLKAFSMLENGYRDLYLAMVGEGPALEGLRRTVSGQKWGDRVKWTGGIIHEDMPRYLAAGDIFWHPSLRMEGMPLVIVEAMASGLAVVATDIGGTAGAIESGKNGILVSPGEPGELERATRELLDQPDRMRDLARSAREKATTQFDYRGIVERLMMDIRTNRPSRGSSAQSSQPGRGLA